MNVPDSDSEDELPPGWEERVTVDGSVYYANHLTKATQWTHPRTGKKKTVGGELPFGWERCVDKNTGKVIYVDHENKRTTYTDPRLAFAVEEKDHANDYRQRFDASSTALQVLHGRDLNGLVAVVTGANSGIGYETAKSLSQHGCRVLLCCRNLQSGEEAMKTIKEVKPEALLHLYEMDLADLKSVEKCAEQIGANFPSLDIVILNAATFGDHYTKTVDGFEKTFQVNHLGHFCFALLLQKANRLKIGARLVIVSSESHRFANINSENVSLSTLSPDKSSYWSMMAYNNSKLCNVLFARLMAKNLQSCGISVFSLHPGNMVSTNLSRNWWPYRLFFFVVRPFTKSLQQAASTSVFCATANELGGSTGVYFNNCFQCEESRSAQDDELALKLWRLSVEMGERILGVGALKIESFLHVLDADLVKD